MGTTNFDVVAVSGDASVGGNLAVTGTVSSSGFDTADVATLSTDDTLDFYIAGTQTTGTLKGGALVGVAGTIADVRAYLDTAPTVANFILDVNLNGTTVFSTQGNRPTVAAGAHASSTTAPDVTAVSAGDRLTFDIDQIGSSVAGAGLYVSITINRDVIVTP